jgi:hypothetical protein
MTLQKALIILNNYQQWQKDNTLYFNPKELSEAIDFILSLFAKIDEKIDEQNQQKNDFYDFMDNLPGSTTVITVDEFGKPTSL